MRGNQGTCLRSLCSWSQKQQAVKLLCFPPPLSGLLLIKAKGNRKLQAGDCKCSFYKDAFNAIYGKPPSFLASYKVWILNAFVSSFSLFHFHLLKHTNTKRTCTPHGQQKKGFKFILKFVLSALNALTS